MSFFEQFIKPEPDHRFENFLQVCDRDGMGIRPAQQKFVDNAKTVSDILFNIERCCTQSLSKKFVVLL